MYLIGTLLKKKMFINKILSSKLHNITPDKWHKIQKQ